MVSAEEVISIYRCLADSGIRIWLTGGWGIDALLGEQTRPHKDIDAILWVDDIVQMCKILDQDGFSLKELWSENSWVMDGRGNKIATAFVLQDPKGREFDAHAIRFDAEENGLPAWAEAENFIFKKDDLAGKGTIDGFPVDCISAEMQLFCHKGYELPDKQLCDLELLHEKFFATK